MEKTPHIMEAFDKDINNIQRTILRMSAFLEEQMNLMIRGLQKPPLGEAARQKIFQNSEVLSVIEKRTHDQTIRLMALRQPVAMDLRQAIAALKISTDIKRMGDYVRGIVIRQESIDYNKVQTMFNSLSMIGQRVVKMLGDVMGAYADSNSDLAVAVWHADKNVDVLYMSFFKEMHKYMMEDPKMITTCLHLIFMAKNIERLGNRITQLAETVYYLDTGQFMDLHEAQDPQSE